MGLLKKIFGTYSSRQLKKIEPICKKVDALFDKYKNMTDEELKNTTPALKKRLADGESLDDILPDAYAAVSETSHRVLHKRLYRVQILAGIILHQGRISEVKTGEGKTYLAACPAYLNALTGEGVHIVTVNEYLARYGSEIIGKVFNFLGLTVGLIVQPTPKNERQDAYNADITYGTNNEMGFDYLRDNLVTYKEQMVQRGHVFAIVDEVDSILIDEARTPLIISGHGEKSTDLYERTDKLVKKMRMFKIKEIDEKQSYEDVKEDYIVDEKARTAVLTKNGIKKAEEYFGIENLSDPENTDISHHVNIGIKAVGVMQNEVDYVVKDEQIVIVDTFTGRMMPGRRWSDGLHQAVEAKEGVKIERESKTQATITFQNYFRLYRKLSGMTGTALTEDNEFREIYNLDVVEIPTNKPMIRKDHNDVVYTSIIGKYKAIIEQIKECHQKGQPILVGTVSVEKSEFLSAILKKEGIKHNVLNAKYHDKEAEIVAQAGRFGAVTISTNMAGRGTDIMLGGNDEFMAKAEMRKETDPETGVLLTESDIVNAISFFQTADEKILKNRAHFQELTEKYKKIIEPEKTQVIEVGGLYILGTERHESRRIDNQLRGRSGRQGDPGEARFFLSLEDDLMRLFGSDRILGIAARLGEDTPIDAKILSNTIESAQKRLEGNNFERRKNVLRYDDVMNQQRKIIYAQRKEVLDGADLKERIFAMIQDSVNGAVDEYCSGEEASEWNFEGLRAHFLEYRLTSDKDFVFFSLEEKQKTDAENIKETLIGRAREIYAQKETIFDDFFKKTDTMREIERVILLNAVDENWMDHIDAMSDLTGSIGLRAYAQRDPIIDYRMEGADMFEAVIQNIKETTVRHIMNVVPKLDAMTRKQVAKGDIATHGGESTAKKKPVVKAKSEKVGRNETCPCGSGKKYKKCCGLNAE
ncbi:MAG: preprotein translocase subunit SecA [Oscillospiraceae bacterium]|nr:preprotein translocase subunit SecA [Oscillospiraceae bacterium]